MVNMDGPTCTNAGDAGLAAAVASLFYLVTNRLRYVLTHG